MLTRFAALLVLVLSAQASAGVLTFQEGVGGYTGNDATYIYFPNRTTIHDSLEFMNTGGSNNAALVRFNDVFGSGAGQVARGATINRATLTLTTLAGFVPRSNEVNDVYAILQDWVSATTTWDSFVGGPSLAELQAKLSPADSPFASFTPNASLTAFDIDITDLVRAWSSGALANHGLAINNLNPGGDSAQFFTDDAAQVSFRPLLTVEFDAAAVPAPQGVLFVSVTLLALRRAKQRTLRRR